MNIEEFLRGIRLLGTWKSEIWNFLHRKFSFSKKNIQKKCKNACKLDFYSIFVSVKNITNL
jgi:hypothetical protein